MEQLNDNDFVRSNDGVSEISAARSTHSAHTDYVLNDLGEMEVEWGGGLDSLHPISSAAATRSRAVNASRNSMRKVMDMNC